MFGLNLLKKKISYFTITNISVISAPSPASGGFGGSSPSPLGYQTSPSPGFNAGTPSPLGYSPMTPGAPYTPQTPGMFMDPGMSDWHTTEIEVKIKETHDDTSLIFQKGQIRSVSVSLFFIMMGNQ